jgi:uncharacterized protein (DUF2267 family)
MSATGLDVFDKTLQVTNIWLGQVMEEAQVDRHVAWHVLGTVLRTVRDRVPIGLAAHLGAQLPLLVRGAYYEEFQPLSELQTYRTLDEFLDIVAEGLRGVENVIAPRQAAEAVFAVMNHYLDPGQAGNVRDALPLPIRELWPEGVSPPPGMAAEGRESMPASQQRH